MFWRKQPVLSWTLGDRGVLEVIQGLYKAIGKFDYKQIVVHDGAHLDISELKGKVTRIVVMGRGKFTFKDALQIRESTIIYEPTPNATTFQAR